MRPGQLNLRSARSRYEVEALLNRYRHDVLDDYEEVRAGPFVVVNRVHCAMDTVAKVLIGLLLWFILTVLVLMLAHALIN
jgi:hypothetical protein